MKEIKDIETLLKIAINVNVNVLTCGFKSHIIYRKVLFEITELKFLK